MRGWGGVGVGDLRVLKQVWQHADRGDVDKATRSEWEHHLAHARMELAHKQADDRADNLLYCAMSDGASGQAQGTQRRRVLASRRNGQA